MTGAATKPPALSFPPQTIGDLLRRVFPRGTRHVALPLPPDQDLKAVPIYPPDVFAAAALLVDAAGLYHHLRPADLKSQIIAYCRSGVCSRSERDQEARRAFDVQGTPALLGKRWRSIRARRDHYGEDGDGNQAFGPAQDLWDVLVEHPGLPLTAPDKEQMTEWQKAAVVLMVMADEASEGVGYPSAVTPDNWPVWFRLRETGHRPTSEPIDSHAPLHRRFTGEVLPTQCTMADPAFVCVQPKARTAMIGATLRTMSHNLAILPGESVLRTLCFPPVPLEVTRDGRRSNSRTESDPLNILLVPYPYGIENQDFDPRPNAAGDDPTGNPPMRWGQFGLDQSWLQTEVKERDIGRMTEDLIRAAEKRLGPVHGVIFPELALDWSSYRDLVQTISRNFPNVEFLIAGSSEDCNGEHANFALMTQFIQTDGERRALTYSRRKHHRWALNETQIATYRLGAVLDPHTCWWEDIMIGPRAIGMMPLRRGSMISVMICEDLARGEPVHGALQSMGPNLIFALLMDGPQITERWPGRAATIFADDPGSSVLTLSSRALIARSNVTRAADRQSWSVALWKDDTGLTVPMACPPDQDAVLVTLAARAACESTLDGRLNSDAWAWRYHAHDTIALVGK